jgi:hypothetical protein
MSFQTFLLRKRFHFVIFIALSFTIGVGFLHLRSLSFGYKEDSSGLRPSNLESHGEEKLSAAITRPISMTSHLSLPPIATPSAISPPAKVGAIVAATRAGGDNSWMEELEDRSRLSLNSHLPMDINITLGGKHTSMTLMIQIPLHISGSQKPRGMRLSCTYPLSFPTMRTYLRIPSSSTGIGNPGTKKVT